MKTFKKVFNFYATDVVLDNYIHSILRGPEVDPEDEIEVSVDRDNYNCYVTLNVFNRVLH
jgi:hypothetical protein